MTWRTEVKATNTERFLLSNSLRIAAEQYDKDAQAMSDTFGPSHGLVETFNKQSAAVRRFADLIEDAEEVIIR